VEAVVVVVGDVERLDEELVEAGGVHPLGAAVEIVGELAGVQHGEHAVPELAQLDAVQVHLAVLPGRPPLLERVVVPHLRVEQRLVPFDLRTARRDPAQLRRQASAVQARPPPCPLRCLQPLPRRRRLHGLPPPMAMPCQTRYIYYTEHAL